MLDDNYLMLGPKVDLNKVEKISTKRLASFLNFFVTETVSFLNKFSSSCEEQLNKLDSKMHDIEILLHILESKISSVPGLDNIREPLNKALETSNTTQTSSNITSNNEIQLDINKDDEAHIEEENTVSVLKNEENKDLKEGWVANKNHPCYKRYFTMLNVGIPIQAVKQKMMMEDLDESILDKPNELSEVPVVEEDDQD